MKNAWSPRDRYAGKRFRSRVSNFLWSLGVFILLILFGLYAYEHWVLPWLSAVGGAI